MVGKRAPTHERFLAKFTKAPGCWEWTAGTNGVGYGMIWSLEAGRKILAHRFSYEYFKGAIPEGVVVRHTCDNPPCVNPEHLLLGTMKDNSQDAAKRGRVGNTRLTAKLVRNLRQDYLDGLPRKAIAEKYGLSVQSISDYTSGRSWGHILSDAEAKSLRDARRLRPAAKLTVDDIVTIRHRFSLGHNNSEIARDYGVRRESIRDIRHGKNWKSVPDD